MDQTIFEVLRGDHEVQRGIVERLAKTQGDSPERRRLYAELKAELSAHAAAEERCFYVPLFAHDLTLSKARHSVAEHHELDELIEALDALSFGSSGWLNQAHSLFERIEHHLREEEREVFQLAGKALADADKLRLAKAYQREMREQREKRDAA